MLHRVARRLLSTDRLPLVLALVALVPTLPALRAGLVADDYFHRMVLLDIGVVGAATDPIADLFAFAPERLHGWMIEQGLVGWWADPALHVSLARPVTALTHVLDYRLWPDDFALQHAHSLAWFALAVGLVAALYRRVHGAGLVAAVAGLLFAVEDAHAMSAGWLASRNALLCLVFGTGLLHQHVTWRETRSRRALLLSLLALGAGLGCGEATLGALAYVVAWQLTRERGGALRRLVPLVPHALVVAAWRLLYDGLGHGTRGSGLYVDPGAQPLLFLGALVERWPLLAAAQFLQAPVDLWLVWPRPAQLAAAGAGALAAAFVVALLWKLLSASDTARFWAVGTALSLVPVCAAFPMDRLLTFAGIGAFALVAMLCESTGVWPWSTASSPTWRGRAAKALLVLHLPVAAVWLAVRVALLPAFGVFFLDTARQAPRGPEVPRQTFVFVNGNDFPVFYLHVIRTVTGNGPVPRRVAQLSTMMAANEVGREDERTLVVAPRGGFLALAVDRLLVGPGQRFFVGETIERPDFVAEVREVTEDGRPRRVAFRFRQPLEAPEYCWLFWKDDRLVPFPLPPPGTRVTIGPGSFMRRGDRRLPQRRGRQTRGRQTLDASGRFE